MQQYKVMVQTIDNKITNYLIKAEDELQAIDKAVIIAEKANKKILDVKVVK